MSIEDVLRSLGLGAELPKIATATALELVRPRTSTDDVPTRPSAEEVGGGSTAAPAEHVIDPTAAEPGEVVTADEWEFPFLVGDSQCHGLLWNGQQLQNPIALDTETAQIVNDCEPPALALAVAADSADKVYLILPSDPQRFLEQHQDAHLIFANPNFDISVLQRAGAGDTLQEMAEGYQIHDVLTLARLIDIAETDNLRHGCYSLEALCDRYLGLPKDGSDSYRLRFGELVGHDWEQPVDPGFLRYAFPDAVLTWRLWQQLKRRSLELINTNKIPRQKVLEFGLFGESLVTRSNIAIGETQRRGIRIDPELARASAELLKDEARQLVDAIAQLEPDYFKRWPAKNRSGQVPGSLLYSGKVDCIPATSTKLLQERLEAYAAANGIQPKTSAKTHEITTSSKWWKNRLVDTPDTFLSRWVRLAELHKLISYFPDCSTDCIRPKYGMTSTLRMTASSPNIQQLPGREEHRRFVLPEPGCLVMSADYSAIESVMLGAYCYETFGHSVLREQLIAGRKIHDHTASWISGIDYETFLNMGQAEKGTPERQQHDFHRQKAKILNFGIPGGFVPATIATFAKETHGMVIEPEEAERLHDEYCHTIYPELAEFMAAPTLEEMVADSLGLPAEVVRETFDQEWMLPTLRRICYGDRCSRAGNEYSDGMIDDLLSRLADCDQQGRYLEALQHDDFARLRTVFGVTATSYAGHLRGGVRHNVACNNSFQSRAALGLRQALWNLHRAGFQLITAVHDEILVSVPEDADHERLARRMQATMAEAMEPFAAGIPVATELYLARHWSKQAPTWDGEGPLEVHEYQAPKPP